MCSERSGLPGGFRWNMRVGGMAKEMRLGNIDVVKRWCCRIGSL